ncbi:hypothetical protein BH24ACT3_BH24ACT3_11440 [soil metagenome]
MSLWFGEEAAAGGHMCSAGDGQSPFAIAILFVLERTPPYGVEDLDALAVKASAAFGADRALAPVEENARRLPVQTSADRPGGAPGQDLFFTASRGLGIVVHGDPWVTDVVITHL